MKTRLNFVSNSSSSSFVIIIEDNSSKPCPRCGRHDPDFIDLIKKEQYNCCDDTRVYGETLEEINKCLTEELGTLTSEIKEPLNKELKKAINKNKKIAYITISYHDERINNELISQSNRDKIRILWKDGELVKK